MLLRPHGIWQAFWQRWDASDLVCTGLASAPVRTGVTRTIDGRDRDQLSSEVKFETCFKGKSPVSSPVRVVGYSVTASKDIRGGYIYSGPPPGFVRKPWPQLRPRKKAVRSPATAAGSSAGAKCPPRGKTVQRWMLYKRSKYERGSSPSGTVWCAKTPNAVGVLT
jgi:hypothetical protein